MLKLKSATAIIAIVTVAVSAFVLLFMDMGVAAAYWGFTSAAVGAKLTGSIAIPWWLTPFTAELLHGGWLHLGINMLVLLFAGSRVERVIGASGLVFAYVVGAGVAAAAQFAVDPGSAMPLVGASGAISALFGLYALFFGKPKLVTRNMKLNRWIHAAWVLAAWAVLQWMVLILSFGLEASARLALLSAAGIVASFVAGVALKTPLLLWRYRTA